MKILFVSYHYWPPHFGGELLLSIERFESLIQRGHEVTVLTSGVPNYPLHENKNGLKIERSPFINGSKFGRGLRRLFFPFWSSQKLMKIDFDVIHLGSAGGIRPLTSTLANLLICSKVKKKGKRIVYVHSLADTENEAYSEDGINGKLRKLYWKQADNIVSVSPALHLAVKQAFPETAICITNAVRDDIFIPVPVEQRDNLRTQYGVHSDQVIFTFLGTPSVRKGFDILTDAFLELKNKHANWILWVIGPITTSENQNFSGLKSLDSIEKLKQPENNVRFWGRIDNRKQLATLLAVSDVFTFPTRREGLPLAPLEAMATGIPIIISKIPGVTDSIIEKDEGIYIPPDDKEALKDAMQLLAEDQPLREKMGFEAHIRITDRFSWQQHLDRWELLYLGCLNGD